MDGQSGTVYLPLISHCPCLAILHNTHLQIHNSEKLTKWSDFLSYLFSRLLRPQHRSMLSESPLRTSWLLSTFTPPHSDSNPPVWLLNSTVFPSVLLALAPRAPVQLWCS